MDFDLINDYLKLLDQPQTSDNEEGQLSSIESQIVTESGDDAIALEVVAYLVKLRSKSTECITVNELFFKTLYDLHGCSFTYDFENVDSSRIWCGGVN
tara:strand:- start:111 stop:404 length:294 start_codon:yes stop_codon:yes gene_type:complete